MESERIGGRIKAKGYWEDCEVVKEIMTEIQRIEELYHQLIGEILHSFPSKKEKLNVSKNHGVYVIYKNKTALHVGRTVSGKKGLLQRLDNHLHEKSTFTRSLHPKLRTDCTFRYLEVPNERERALLEALAIGKLCPKHIGLGKKKILLRNTKEASYNV